MVRNQIHLLQDFENRLISVEVEPDILIEAESLLSGSAVTEVPIKEVLELVDDRCEAIVSVVASLLLELSSDDDESPLSREGVPNKLIQKLFRECHGIEVTMRILGMLFSKVRVLAITTILSFSIGFNQKKCVDFACVRACMRVQGIPVDSVEHDKRFSAVKMMCTYLYRLMKQAVKENITNSMRLFQFMDTIQSHLGKGLSCMQVIVLQRD